MNTITKLLNHSVAGPFYRQHAGAFLFLFFILFGINPYLSYVLKTHYAFITGILTSIHFFLIALLCWVLYGLKTILFFRSCLQKEAYNFLYTLNAISPAKRYLVLLRLNILLMAPVTGYGVLILSVAIKDHHAATGLLVTAAIVILCLLTTLTFYSLLLKAKTFQEITRKKNSFPFPKTLSGFVLKFIWRKQFITLFIVKLLSFGCLYFFAITETSVFEERMLWLLYITVLIGHSIIVYKNFHFMETELNFYRNLPVRKIATLLSLFVVYTIILLPEAWALRGVIINQGNARDYIWMILTGPSLLLLLHCLLYTEDMKMEEFLKLLFGVWIVFVFFSLPKSHWILPSIALTFSTIIFLMSYYNYEKNTEIKGLE